jgi:hypothetical protein
MRQSAKRFGIGMVLMTLAAPTLVHAQQDATSAGHPVVTPTRAEAPAPAWGTASMTAYVVSAWEMQSEDSSPLSQLSAFPLHGRWSPTTQWVMAPLHLPAGALIASVELEGCLDTTAGSLQWILYQVGEGGIAMNIVPMGDTGTNQSGCGYWSVTVFPGWGTVDNLDYHYVAGVKNTGDGSGLVRFAAVRVYYQLQVSPGPATATFIDVPTSSPYFKFVEAVSAAGIVAGCGKSQYCPNNPVTRGQMAVFLASALGMHFPN